MLTALPTSALAPQFDWNNPVTLTGIVTTVEWANSRAYACIDVRDAAGATANWTLELGSPNVLVTRYGWTATLLKQGDRVTADGWQAKDGEKHMSVRSVTVMNGKEFFAAHGENNE